MKEILSKKLQNLTLSHIGIPIMAVISLTLLSSAQAFALGLTASLIFKNPYAAIIKHSTHKLLAISIVGLGFGMDLGTIGRVGAQGFLYTILGLSFTFLLGLSLGRALKTSKDTSLLITVGTGICGGSAIAAAAPVMGAKHDDVVISLSTVFMLNAFALMIFPFLGHYFQLSESQFGLWCALSIHDTSSVLGATMQYGPIALAIGTTVKLARALWIMPVAASIGLVRQKSNGSFQSFASSIKLMWFIVGFIAAAFLVTFFPTLKPAGILIQSYSQRIMVMALFFIGASLTPTTLKNVGARSFMQGIILWLLVSTTSLIAILMGFIVMD